MSKGEILILGILVGWALRNMVLEFKRHFR